jgi:hypothetical protein
VIRWLALTAGWLVRTGCATAIRQQDALAPPVPACAVRDVEVFSDASVSDSEPGLVKRAAVESLLARGLRF